MKSRNAGTDFNFKPFVVLAALVAAIAVAGCGTDSKADLVNGKVNFVKTCGSCHTLARANTSGTVGPNLDLAFQASRKEGMNDKTIEGVVRSQIAYPGAMNRSVPNQYVMPANLATGDTARDIAAYVGYAAARPGKDANLLASAGGGTDGKSIFSLKCGSCHTLAAAGTSGKVGPDLDGIGKQGVPFITESIEDPNAKITAGFSPNVMPQDFKTTLQAAQLKALIAFLAKQK